MPYRLLAGGLFKVHCLGRDGETLRPFSELGTWRTGKGQGGAEETAELATAPTTDGSSSKPVPALQDNGRRKPGGGGGSGRAQGGGKRGQGGKPGKGGGVPLTSAKGVSSKKRGRGQGARKAQ